jgi:hypothetical protein
VAVTGGHGAGADFDPTWLSAVGEGAVGWESALASAAGAGRTAAAGTRGRVPSARPAISGSSALSAVGSSTGENVAAPTLADTAPISIVRSRVIRWVNMPLLRSVNCTPATISAAASSTAARVGSGLAAPA